MNHTQIALTILGLLQIGTTITLTIHAKRLEIAKKALLHLLDVNAKARNK